MALTQIEVLVISGANMFLLLIITLCKSARLQEQHYIKCSTNKQGE